MIQELESLSERLEAKRRLASIKCQQSESITDVANYAGQSEGLADAIIEVKTLIGELILKG